MKRILFLVLIFAGLAASAQVVRPTSGYSDPLTTAGDLLYYGASGSDRLQAGANGQVLTMGATYPEWAAAGSGGDTSNFNLVENAIITKAGIDEIVTDTLTLGSDADNVSGVLNLIASDGDAGDLTITTDDYLLINGFTRVGVLNATPTVALDVTGEGKFSGAVTSPSGFVGTSFVAGNYYLNTTNGLYNKTTDIRIAAGTTASRTAYIHFLTNNNDAAATERMRIAADGNVGIGTTSPQEKLDVNYADGVFLRSFRGTTDTDITGWITTNANGDTCYMYPNAAGNGIEVSTTKP